MEPIARLLLTGLAVASLTVPAAARAPMRKVIIDDDGFGLKHVMLLEAKDVEVLGITTVSGDAWANRVTAAALHGLEVIGRTDVPMVPGATYPLVNPEALTDRWEAFYGKLTWKGAWMRNWVKPTTQPAPAYHGPTTPTACLRRAPSPRPRSPPSSSFAWSTRIRTRSPSSPAGR